MSKSTGLYEESHAAHPGTPWLSPDPEVQECLDYIRNNKAIVVATEMAHLRRQAILGEKDFLTGIRNRMGLNQDLPLLRAIAVRTQEGEDPKEILVSVVDLDGLKEINDTQGHDKGDELLVKSAKALLGVSRGSDIVARLGGDEFALLCLVNGLFDGEVVKKKIRTKLKDIEASIGYTIWESDEDFEDAYKRADEEMYKDKAERKNING